MRGIIVVALSLAANGTQAMQPPGDAQIKADLSRGEELETRIAGDLNSDGVDDIAYIVRGDDKRTLRVRLAGKGKIDFGHAPLGMLDLDAYPLGAAEMSVAKGVLVVKDLTGGTTATTATYRFRLDPEAGRMKLIGLDATMYSRTFAHDGSELSWNLLTGDVITSTLKLSGSGENASYQKTGLKRFRRPIRVYWMEDAPSGDDAFDAAAK
ncbi:MAG TPA: hypothetical protein PK217_08135 [Sphingopyxis terrae]|nr:hypothetical protein [Sphingopyxis terrae]